MRRYGAGRPEYRSPDDRIDHNRMNSPSIRSYRFFLLSLILLFISYPALMMHGFPGRVTELLLTILVLTAGSILRVGKTRRSLVTLVSAALVVLVWVGSLVMPGLHWLVPLRILFFVTFLAQIMITLIRDVFHAPNITSTNRLYGAVCIYLLMGIFFGNLYIALDVLLPGSFECRTTLCGQEYDTNFIIGLHLYYSFATITTVGYGDIVPRNTFAAMLSNLEAIFGQVYMAVVVARLVGIHLMDRDNPG